MVKPISPNEMQDAQATRIPDFIIEAVNELLAKHYRNGRATIYQDDVMDAVMARQTTWDRATIYENNWLDF